MEHVCENPRLMSGQRKPSLNRDQGLEVPAVYDWLFSPVLPSKSHHVPTAIQAASRANSHLSRITCQQPSKPHHVPTAIQAASRANSHPSRITCQQPSKPHHVPTAIQASLWDNNADD
ncbi:hypothetical protein ACOMHN_026064 [Nucella lapillus]